MTSWRWFHFLLSTNNRVFYRTTTPYNDCRLETYSCKSFRIQHFLALNTFCISNRGSNSDIWRIEFNLSLITFNFLIFIYLRFNFMSPIYYRQSLLPSFIVTYSPHGNHSFPSLWIGFYYSTCMGSQSCGYFWQLSSWFFGYIPLKGNKSFIFSNPLAPTLLRSYAITFLPFGLPIGIIYPVILPPDSSIFKSNFPNKIWFHNFPSSRSLVTHFNRLRMSRKPLPFTFSRLQTTP